MVAEKRGYEIVGKNKHSGVSLCRWCKTRLRGGRNCYKKIFGIDSHRCIQMTPCLDFCPFSCVFCWRTFRQKRFKKDKGWDKPKEIVDELIKAQKKILSGFGGSKYVSKERFQEANKPTHFAMSLDGEPGMYPFLVDLVEEIKSRGFSVFVVTNGAVPMRIREFLKKGVMPDNLSISVYATNAGDYLKITNSKIPNPLEKVKESLLLLKKFENCRTNVRLTLVKSLNLKDANGYSELIKTGNPRFVTLKGYTHLGESQKRLNENNMPSMEEIEEFSNEIAEKISYLVKHKDRVSRVVILVRDEESLKWNEKKNKEQKERFAKAIQN